MKRNCCAYVAIIIGLCIALALALGGCANPLQPAATSGSITGRALFSGQTDHSGIAVSAESADELRSLSVQRLLAGALPGSKAIAAQAITNADGSYTLSGLAAGSYTVYASSRNSLEKAVTTSVTVVAGRSVTAVDLNLTPTGQISGTATLNSAGSGNLGIVVFIAGTSYAAMSADDGSYTISDVPAGAGYVLVASKQGYDSAIVTVDVSIEATTSAPVLNLLTYVAPAATGSVFGSARLNGASTGNTGIFVFLAGTSYITMTDDAGSYNLSDVAPASYTLVASKEGYVSASTSVNVTAGGDFSAGILDLSGVQVSAPQFSPSTGTYSSGQLVTISDATPGAAIYYTTNGSTPTTGSTVYNSPITVTGNGSSVTITVKAIATRAGMTNSAVSTARYSFVYPMMTAQWAQTVSSGSSGSVFKSVAVDAAGNVYAAGYISGTGTYTFGPGVTATGTSASNLVLVKYTGSTAQWSQTVTGTGDSVFNSVTVDAGGNVYAAGKIQGTGTYTFGPHVTATGSYSGSNMVLVNYDSTGAAQWARMFTIGTSATSDSEFTSLEVDSNGNAYAAGYVGHSFVLVKYSSAGGYVAQTAGRGSSGYSSFNAIAVDASDNVYAGGYISGTAVFKEAGPGIGGVEASGTYGGGSNVVLVKYDSHGEAQWARSVTSGASASSFASVAVDSAGDVYAAGEIQGPGPSTFGEGIDVMVRPTYSGSNVVLVQYDAGGTAQWARSVTSGTSASSFASVAVDSAGDVYAAGYISGGETYTFGPSVTATGTSASQLVLVSYRASGVVQWAQSVRGRASFNSVAADRIGNVYAVGTIGGGKFTFGESVIVEGASAEGNVVLVKYSE